MVSSRLTGQCIHAHNRFKTISTTPKETWHPLAVTPSFLAPPGSYRVTFSLCLFQLTIFAHKSTNSLKITTVDNTHPVCNPKVILGGRVTNSSWFTQTIPVLKLKFLCPGNCLHPRQTGMVGHHFEQQQAVLTRCPWLKYPGCSPFGTV